MNKRSTRKMLLAFSVMLLVALMTVGVVAAKGDGPQDHPHGPGNGQPGRGVGPRNIVLVTAISGNTITAETLGGDEISFSVDADTVYHSGGEAEASFADIAVGSYIAGKLSEDGGVAEVVAILPEDFDPETFLQRLQDGMHGRRGRRGLGQVTAVGSDSITVETPRGEEVEFAVNADTEYVDAEGEAASLADIAVGDWIAAKLVGNGEGNPLAEKVVLLPEDFEPQQPPFDGGPQDGNGGGFGGPQG